MPLGRTKYRAVRCNGYASKREARIASELEILERVGKITNLNKQVSYALLPAAEGYPRPLRYVADFTYMDGGEVVVADAKGFKTPVYLIKKRLMRQLLGIEITEL